MNPNRWLSFIAADLWWQKNYLMSPQRRGTPLWVGANDDTYLLRWSRI